MPSLSDNNQISLFANLNCDADLVAPEYITADEKMLIRERCSGTQNGIIDCHCFDIPKFIEDAGGLDLNTKIITCESPLIQQNIVVVPREWFDRPAESIEGDIVGINLKDILSHRPHRHWGFYELSDDIRIDLSALQSPIFWGKQVVLFASAIDVVIEKLWFLKNDISLFDEIAKGNFYAVTGMNFSLFLHECPLGQLINTNKSLLFVQKLGELGVSVMPHVYAVNDKQRDKWVEYLNSNPIVKTVVINTQLQRDKYSMREVVETVEVLLEKTNVNIVLNGFKPRHLSGGLGERVFIANQHGLKRRAIIEKARGYGNLTMSSTTI